jgi:hypothetical protein
MNVRPHFVGYGYRRRIALLRPPENREVRLARGGMRSGALEA